MAREHLDLTAGVSQSGLNLEDIAHLGRLLGDPLERDLAGLEVPYPRFKVDDLTSHFDRLGVLRDDLRRLAAQSTEQIERGLPAVGRDAIGDLCGGSVAVVAGRRSTDVAPQRDDPVASDPQGSRHILDFKVHRPGPDDLRVIPDHNGSVAP